MVSNIRGGSWEPALHEAGRGLSPSGPSLPALLPLPAPRGLSAPLGSHLARRPGRWTVTDLHLLRLALCLPPNPPPTRVALSRSQHAHLYGNGRHGHHPDLAAETGCAIRVPGKLVRGQLRLALPGEQEAGVQPGARGEPETSVSMGTCCMNRPRSWDRRCLTWTCPSPTYLWFLNCLPGREARG